MVIAIAKEDRLLTITDAARMLGVHANTLRRWNDRGLIRAYRLGNRGDRRFALAEVIGLLNRLDYAYKTTSAQISSCESR
jgi:excisionase family DNA binding protein